MPRKRAEEKQLASGFPVFAADVWDKPCKNVLVRPQRHTESILNQMLCELCGAEGAKDCAQCEAEVKKISGKRKKTRRGKRKGM